MLDLEPATKNQIPRVQFSSSEHPSDAPDWFRWGVRFGQQLSISRSSLESGLILLTTPCESPLLGTLALGMLSHLLEMQSDNVEQEQHFESLFQMPSGTLVKRKAENKSRARVYKLLSNRCREDGIKMKMVKGPKKFKDCVITLSPQAALTYVLEDEEETCKDRVHSLSPYPGAALMELISSTIPDSQTWRNNLDQILISGPTGGNSSPKKQLAGTSLVNCEGEGLELHEMLAVKEWKSSKVHGPYYSRFLNSSAAKAEFPEVARKARFVLFNSIDSYLRYTDKFSTQLQVVVCSRDVDSHKTERLYAKLYAYRDRAQQFDSDVLPAFESPPFGIQLFFLGAKGKKEKKW